MSANLWLTFSKNVEQTFLDSLILPFVKIGSRKKIYEKIDPFSKQKSKAKKYNYLGRKKQALYDIRKFTEIIMLG